MDIAPKKNGDSPSNLCGGLLGGKEKKKGRGNKQSKRN